MVQTFLVGGAGINAEVWVVDMGIGSTTPSAAIGAVVTGTDLG
jgi:hypothetical protein